MSITEVSSTDSGHDEAGPTDVDHTFTLWPHRSLPRSGLIILLSLVSLGAVLPLLHVSGPALWVVGLPCVSMPLALAIAFCANNKSARALEKISIGPRLIRLERFEAKRGGDIDVFNTAWARVIVRTDAQCPYRVLLAEGAHRVTIGEFLSPDERLDLAQALGRVLGSGRVDMTQARPPLHEFEAHDYA